MMKLWMRVVVSCVWIAIIVMMFASEHPDFVESILGTSTNPTWSQITDDESLQIRRFTPEREVVIDTLINRGAERLFRAQTNKNNTSIEMVAKNLDDGSDLMINVTDLISADPWTIISSKIEVSKPGKYRITALAELDGEVDSISWDWVVNEQSNIWPTAFRSDKGLIKKEDWEGGTLQIWRSTPDRETVIDTLINRDAQHVFEAKTNRDNATMKMVLVDLDDGSLWIPGRTNQKPTHPGTAIESEISVGKTGKYRVTASVEIGGEVKSVNWDWIVNEQSKMCSTVFRSDEGFYFHICELDARMGHLASTMQAWALTFLAPESLSFVPMPLFLVEAVFYHITKNLDDESIDIFIGNGTP